VAGLKNFVLSKMVHFLFSRSKKMVHFHFLALINLCFIRN